MENVIRLKGNCVQKDGVYYTTKGLYEKFRDKIGETAKTTEGYRKISTVYIQSGYVIIKFEGVRQYY